jgi:hypothetical protein
MAEISTAPAIASLDELLEYREITEHISGFLVKRLKDHLATLWPLLAPGRVLGKHVGARDAVSRADEARAELSQKFQEAAGALDLKVELDDEALSAVGAVIKVYPFEYNHEARGAKASKKIAMTSPVRWVVTYGSEYSLGQFRGVFAAPSDRRIPPVRQFVINALTFNVVLGRNPALVQLLKDLRWEVEEVALPGFEKLKVTAFRMALPSFRPQDELLLTAVRLSGVPAFIELIDTNALHHLADDLRNQLEALIQPAS